MDRRRRLATIGALLCAALGLAGAAAAQDLTMQVAPDGTAVATVSVTSSGAAVLSASPSQFVVSFDPERGGPGDWQSTMTVGGNGVAPGEYTFRVTVSGEDGATTGFSVAVRVTAPPATTTTTSEPVTTTRAPATTAATTTTTTVTTTTPAPPSTSPASTASPTTTPAAAPPTSSTTTTTRPASSATTAPPLTTSAPATQPPPSSPPDTATAAAAAPPGGGGGGPPVLPLALGIGGVAALAFGGAILLMRWRPTVAGVALPARDVQAVPRARRRPAG